MKLNITRYEAEKLARRANIQGTTLQSTAFSGLSKITVGPTPPSSPSIGDLWVDTNP